MKGIRYTIFVDCFATGETTDTDLPETAKLVDAVDIAVSMNKDYRYHNSGIRVGAYMPGCGEAKLVWANEVIYRRLKRIFSA